jgi:hypothetical protein
MYQHSEPHLPGSDLYVLTSVSILRRGLLILAAFLVEPSLKSVALAPVRVGG